MTLAYHTSSCRGLNLLLDYYSQLRIDSVISKLLCFKEFPMIFSFCYFFFKQLKIVQYLKKHPKFYFIGIFLK